MKEKSNAVLLDLDGTAADVSAARHYVDGSESKDFDAFHLYGSTVAPANDFVHDLCNILYETMCVIIVTGREEKWRVLSEDWLQLHGFKYDFFFCRRNKDYRPDTEIKREIYDIVKVCGFENIIAIDDRPSVIRMWESLGLYVLRVPGWSTPD